MKGGKMPWEGEKIKGLAKEKKITLINLAEQIGVSRQAVNDWTNGKVPKGNHLIALCRILSVNPENLFSDDSSETISMPVHRTRKKAKVNEHMQQDSMVMVKEYKNLFKNISDSVVVPVIRTRGRDEESAIKIAEKLRTISGVKNDEPMDYGDAFHLLDQLGITTIFRYFPESVKDYALYTRIYDHRVVFVNNSTNLLDLIFPILHEAVHAIRDEAYTNGFYDTEEEEFCDNVANYVQFPDEYVKFVFEAINGLPVSHKINNLKIFGHKYSHSLFGIFKRLKTIAPGFKLNIGGADTNLKKEFRTIGDILFEDDDPKSFVELLSALTPRFINTLKEQIENISSRKLGQLLGLESALDAKEIKKMLTAT
jgi:transcriptional regulator with XRE-family HTH domain